jgi:hypothetical protein
MNDSAMATPDHAQPKRARDGTTKAGGFHHITGAHDLARDSLRSVPFQVAPAEKIKI